MNNEPDASIATSLATPMFVGKATNVQVDPLVDEYIIFVVPVVFTTNLVPSLEHTIRSNAVGNVVL